MSRYHPIVTCDRCGTRITTQWLGRHLASGCRQGNNATLSHRQWQIVRRLAMEGTSVARIALEIGIQPGTVKNHLREARKRLGVVGEGKTTLLMTALQYGEVTMDELIAPAHVLGRPR